MNIWLAYIFHDFLLNRTKVAVAVGVEHVDLDRVAELHKWRFRFAVGNDFQHAFFGQTAGATACILIGDGAGAHDGAGGQRS